MVKIVCQHCGIEGYLQHIGKNYYRVRHYVGYRNGKPVFKYHRQDPTYVLKLLNSKEEEIGRCGQGNIDLTGQNVDLEKEANTFKSENKRVLSGGSGSIVRSSAPDEVISPFKRFLSIDLTQARTSVTNHASKLRIMLKSIDKPANEITKEDLRSFLEVADRKYAVQTYNCFIKTIRRFFRDYLNKPELATFHFKTVPFTPKIMNLSKSDLRDFYDAIDHPIVKMMFLAYCVTGLRRNDIMYLMINELDRDNRMMVKTNQSRTKHRWVTFYNTELSKVLHPYLDKRNDDNLRVFPVDKYKTFPKYWSMAAAKTGIKITPKDLRDWFNNEMMKLGVPETYINAFCGRIPRTVLRRNYVNYNPMKLKEIYDKANLAVFS
ncbi:MAG: integrase [Candidatus Bathyarchaeota archaeon]|nr:integrase [Candidatus Bathyarchaeota archaeon]